MPREIYEKSREEWKNKPDMTTPIEAKNMNHVENGIVKISEQMALREVYEDEYMDLTTYNPDRTVGTRSIQHGFNVNATGEGSYAGGSGTSASGNRSHAEGNSSKATGADSHAEGVSTNAIGSNSHAEGYQSKAEKDAAHSEGYSTVASGSHSHAEGYSTIASGHDSHSEGNQSSSAGDISHAEGSLTTAAGNYSHAEGNSTTASGQSSHAEGNSTNAIGSNSHVEGNLSKAYCTCGHAEGYGTVAGIENASILSSAHAEGYMTTAAGNYSHAEGNSTTASGQSSHAEGEGTISNDYCQHVGGKYNAPISGPFTIGGGTSDSNRKNISWLDWSGNLHITGDLRANLDNRTISLTGLKTEMEGRYDYLQSMITSIQSGIVSAKVFETKVALDEWLAEEGNPETLKTGQNIYIVETGTPDYWWDGTGLQVLETDEVVTKTLTYDETMETLNGESTESRPNLEAIRDWCKSHFQPVNNLEESL